MTHVSDADAEFVRGVEDLDVPVDPTPAVIGRLFL